jgi:hypothetical protein
VKGQFPRLHDRDAFRAIAAESESVFLDEPGHDPAGRSTPAERHGVILVKVS